MHINVYFYGNCFRCHSYAIGVAVIFVFIVVFVVGGCRSCCLCCLCRRRGYCCGCNGGSCY